MTELLYLNKIKMQKKKILSLAIATATVVTGLVGVTTATTPEVLDN